MAIDFIDEQKIFNEILSPAIDKINKETIPALDTVLENRLSQVTELLAKETDDVKLIISNSLSSLQSELQAIRDTLSYLEKYLDGMTLTFKSGLEVKKNG